MTPIGEIRVAIPVGLMVYNLNWFYVFFISVLGNLVPVIFLLLLLEKISNYLSGKSQIFQRFFSWLFERTRKKYNSRMKKYDYLALMAFVAIPLPLTGAWTACLVAFLFGIPFKKAFTSILFGIIMAGLIVTLITKTGIVVERYLGWQILIGFLLSLVFILLMCYKVKKSRECQI